MRQMPSSDFQFTLHETGSFCDWSGKNAWGGQTFLSVLPFIWPSVRQECLTSPAQRDQRRHLPPGGGHKPLQAVFVGTVGLFEPTGFGGFYFIVISWHVSSLLIAEWRMKIEEFLFLGYAAPTQPACCMQIVHFAFSIPIICPQNSSKFSNVEWASWLNSILPTDGFVTDLRASLFSLFANSTRTIICIIPRGR